MNRFWKSIIYPLFNEINPKCIVEVGADTGVNTLNMLNYCVNNNSKLISIDPYPNFDVNNYKEEFSSNFEFVYDLSLNVLSSIEGYDLILIDGDHNWYTVYNELKLIENKFNQDSFPVIILHDVSWPYGRRDLYYNPDNIPKEFLNEFDKLGMLPNHDELVKIGGINSDLNNALHENTPKNGVLTAVEDFLKETTLNLSFFKINGFNGLGIIYPDEKFADSFLQNLVLNSDIVEEVEINYFIKSANKDKRIIYLTDENQRVSEELDIIKNRVSELTKINQDLKSNIGSLEEANLNLIGEYNVISLERDNLNNDNKILLDKVGSLEEKNSELNSINESLASKNNSLLDYNNLLIDKFNNMKKSIATLTAERDSLVQDYDNLSAEHDSLVKYINRLMSENDSLDHHNKILMEKVDSLTKCNHDLVLDKESLIQRDSILSKSKVDLLSKNSSLNQSNANLISEREALINRNSSLTNSNLKLSSENNSLIERNIILTKTKSSLEQENQKLLRDKHILFSSNSWKITSPLRKFSTFIRKLKK